MRAVVTGGAGFIGSHLCERLLSSCLSDDLLRAYGAGTAEGAQAPTTGVQS
jgi:nucleoside-diphosphate-sugar epimerase